MRGFLLAGKEEFFERFNNEKQSFGQLIAQLSTTVSDNNAQVQLLGEAKLTIDNWVRDVVEPQLELRRDIGSAKTMDDMADIVGQAKGKVYFDKFRAQIATFNSRESSLMAQRRDELRNTGNSFIATTMFSTLLAIIIGISIAICLTNHVMILLGGEPIAIANIARTVAKGDLTMQLELSSNGESIYAQMKNMMEALREKEHWLAKSPLVS
ncbi:MAG: CHASE3 domain-containing protein [Psychrobium sp.]|nr:CHASE3 domain-containing protein [Psychrobium sp.]